MKAYVLLLPIDRIAADQPFHSGKHKKYGTNVQVIADSSGRLLLTSPALPGAVHDLRADRETGIIDIPAEAVIPCCAPAEPGATVRAPGWGRWGTLSTGQQSVNRFHAKLRALAE